MNAELIKKEIKSAVQAFSSGNLTKNSLRLFDCLGYVTDRQAPLDKPDFDEFRDLFVIGQKFDQVKARTNEWRYVDLLFQLSKTEVLKQTSLFDTKKVDQTIIETYLFFVIELSGQQYSRTDLALITREVNRLFPMPAMILFKYGNLITLSVIHRRLSKKDPDKNVLEKVTLIKDIKIDNPNRAHIEILFDLTFEKLQQDTAFSNFVELHNAWQKTLDIKLLNEKFYKEIAYWFFWAVNQVEFPDDDPYYAKRETRNTENVIRLLTRVIFCWFMKEKRLIKPELFSQEDIEKLLIKDADLTGSTYYKAILQNLFFATLNIPVNKRKFISSKTYQGKNNDYFDNSVFRYERFFKPDAFYLSFFKEIPFLNGGLFECQDYMGENENGEKTPVRIDCFSNNPKNEERLKVPDEIFFGSLRKENWLNETFGTKNQDYLVRGLFNILSDYKFTIEENTPLEEEIALDPDLLGIVFENLLASYNPETRATARKQTGSFYTPREIVNYMVDESLIAYFSNQIKNLNDERLREFVIQHNAEPEFSDQERVDLITAIETIKILDPACGSGAFPMGILNKLVHLIHKLDRENILWRERMLNRTPMEIRKETEEMLNTKSADYIRKLGLIQNCIYGVDIQPIAVEISKLRFFLALLVDFKRTNDPEKNWGIEPLPNLDFKIMQGNSLVEEINGVSLSITPKEKSGILTFIDAELQAKIAVLHELQGFYLRETHPEKKKKLKAKTHDLLIEIFHYHLEKIKSTYFNELKKIEEVRNRLKIKENADKYYENEKAKVDQKFGFNYLNFEKELKDLISGKKPLKFFPFSLFFADVFEKGGFDLVIGNPPFVVTRKGLYSGYDWEGDLYTMFYEKSLKELLKENGTFSFITPRFFLFNQSNFEMRQYLLDKVRIISMIESNPFSAITENVISIIKTDQVHCEYINFYLHIDNEIKYNNTVMKDWIRANKYLEINPYITKEVFSLLEKIRIGKTLLGVIARTRRGAEISKNDLRETIVGESILLGYDVDRFIIKPTNAKINTNHKEYQRLEDIFNSKNVIFLRRVSKDLVSAVPDYPIAFNKNLYAIDPHNDVNKYYLSALLNSTLINFYYKHKFSTKKEEVFPEIQTYLFEQLPIKKIDKNYQLLIEKLYKIIVVQQIENLSSNFFERLLDSIFYELYFPESILEARCEVVEQINYLLKNYEHFDKTSVESIFYAFFNNKPLQKALDMMEGIEEIRLIEGKK